MKFAIPRQDLADALACAFRAVSTRALFPALSGVLVDAARDKITLTATDGDLTIVTRVPAEVQAEGAAVLPARFSLELVRRLQSGDVVVHADGGHVTIESADSQYTVGTFPTSEFPERPDIAPVAELTLPTADMGELIAQTSYAAASGDTARPVLTGTLLELFPDKVKAVACDGFRLAIKEVQPSVQGTGSCRVIIPTRALQELERVLGGDGGVTLTVAANHVLFKLGETMVYSRLIEGQFVDYARVIPELQGTTLRVRADAFAGALERLMLLARDVSFNAVKLLSSAEFLRITSHAPDMGSAVEKVPLLSGGDGDEVSLNARFVLDFLRAVHADNIDLSLAAKRGGALLFRPCGEEGHLYILMPLTL